ncbi:energy transducer TonB [Pseudomonas nitroreducens]|uniref:Protein TonB n=1 Tax=Pseudomonas nitroreducens TaxID=46680 RepID=A0A5R8ZZU8_PSENT|nr:energy transducer TonB [Pseudomonas nitroreducens]TLP71046.1 energy transducer TonB [Pseudomonas nitroreducens]
MERKSGIARVGLLLAVAAMTACSSVPKDERPRLVPRYMAPPEYPQQFKPRGIDGTVKTTFDIEASGHVSNVQIVESSNAALAEAVRERVAQWRFEPWQPTAKYPAPQQVIKTFEFKQAEAGTPTLPSGKAAGNSEESLANTVRELLAQPCSAISSQYAEFHQAYPDRPLDQLATFRMTSGALFLAQLGGKLDVEKNRLIGKRFDAALPRVLERCQREPETVYSDVLAEEMRRAQVDSAGS